MSKKIIFVITLLASLVFSAGPVAAYNIATLSWTAPTTNEDASPLTDLAGYKIYYGETSIASGTCPVGYGTTIDTGDTDTTYDITNVLTEGHTYYFQVTAYDTSDNESACSTSDGEVSKLVRYAADINEDGTVSLMDYNLFLPTFGQNGTGLAGDLMRHGTVNLFDYNIFLEDFGKSIL